MVYLSDTGRTELVAAVRNYLEHVPNVHGVKEGYAGTNTAYLLNFMSRTFCSSARPHPPNTYLQVYELHLQDLLKNGVGLAPDVAAVANFSLTPQHVASIQQTLQRKRGISVIHVGIRTEIQGGHACLLVFDARTRKQHFFNPWGYRNHWMNIAFANRDVALVEGFRAASRNEDAWVNQAESMQIILDVNQYHVHGNCAMYGVLVGVLCTRFGLGKPKLMATIITEAIKEIDAYNGFNVEVDNPANSHMSRLWNWMNEMSDVAKETRTLPSLNANSTNTPEMVTTRHNRIQEAKQVINNFPELPGPPANSARRVENRKKLRQRQLQYLQSHPIIHQGHPVSAATVEERTDVLRKAEQTLIRLMFPPSMRCDVVVRSGELCSRRACVGQPLCWQHRFLTRNHVLTGPGRMRCAAVQQPC